MIPGTLKSGLGGRMISESAKLPKKTGASTRSFDKNVKCC